MNEILNTYVQYSLKLSVITISLPKIHKFYEKLLFNVQSLETLGKLKEISGYARMFINKLQGIRGNLVRSDDNWREWDFPNYVGAPNKWTERYPVKCERTKKPPDWKKPPFLHNRSFQALKKDE